MSRVCPWSFLSPGSVAFCEARLCAWVDEPANAWSSMVYVLVGLLMLREPARWGGGPIIAAQLLIGVGSFFFHGTGTFAGELVDQTGMYLLSALVLVEAAGAPRGWDTPTRTRIYAGLVAGSTLLNLLIRPIGIPLFAAQLLVGVVWQIQQGQRAQGADRERYRWFYSSLGLFGVSFGLWLTDISGLLCDPDNHVFTGHSAWHTLNAVCTAGLGRFYARTRG